MKKILQIKNIKKKFNEKIVHQNISFDLKENESLGVLGPSGTGKSVLLRSIIGLDLIDDGEIYYESKRIDNLKEKDYFSIRKKISYSFQDGALFDSINVFENLAYPLYAHTNLSYKEISQKIHHYLDLIDMEGTQHLMPSSLSGGMKKRVGMARALILGPKIILYDEPTAGLDPVNTRRIIGVMKKFKQLGQSAIFVSHDIPSIIDFCNRIIMLKNGTVFFDGSTEEFQNSPSEEIISFIREEKDHV